MISYVYKKIKEKLNLYLSQNHKITSKRLKTQLKGNMIKTVEKVMGQYLYYYPTKEFAQEHSKGVNHRENINNLIKEYLEKPQTGENLQHIYSTNYFPPKTHKHVYESLRKRQPSGRKFCR